MIIPMFQKYMNMHFVVKPTASYPQFEDITPASTDATEDEDDDYDDEDDMESLLNTSSGEKGQSSSNKEEGCEKSVLDDIKLSIDDEDDVGEVIAEK